MSLNDTISDAFSGLAQSAIGQAVYTYGRDQLATAASLATGEINPADFLGESFGNWLGAVASIGGFGNGGPGGAGATSPFTGGQCVGAKYNFHIRYDYPPFGPQDRTYNGWYGPIVGTRVVQASNGNYNLQFGTHTSHTGQPQSTVRWANVTNNGDKFENIRIEDVVRVGGVDDCGNPDAAYPLPPADGPYLPQDDLNGVSGGFVPDGYGYAGGQPAVCFLNDGIRFCFGPGGSSIDFNADGIPEIDQDPVEDCEGTGLTDGDGDGVPDIEGCVCGDGTEENSWPITLPKILTADSNETEVIAGLPQAIAWLARNIDATTGAYPIKIEIEDTDPTTPELESKLIEFPNAAEMQAETFGVIYETNQNVQILLTAVLQLIPEVIATKNTAIINQDFITTIAEYMGMRTQDKAINVPCNFNPERPDNLSRFFEQSNMVLKGVEDVDPHTMVQWLQKIQYWAQLAAIPNFRTAANIDVLEKEVDSYSTEPKEDAEQQWDEFREFINGQVSTLNRDDANPRPKIIPLVDATEPGSTIPPVQG